MAEVGIRELSADETMGKVSIVGAGMKSHPASRKVFSTSAPRASTSR
jgi:aspartokinase